jgi:hypothetical protein
MLASLKNLRIKSESKFTSPRLVLLVFQVAVIVGSTCGNYLPLVSDISRKNWLQAKNFY